MAAPYHQTILLRGEYKAMSELLNPELLLPELGGGNGSKGGYITALLGCPVDPSEVKVFRQQSDNPQRQEKIS